MSAALLNEKALTTDDVIDATLDMLALTQHRGWRLRPDGSIRSSTPRAGVAGCDCPLVALLVELGYAGSRTGAWMTAWFEVLGPDPHGTEYEAAAEVANAADYHLHPLRPRLLAALGLAEAAGGTYWKDQSSSSE